MRKIFATAAAAGIIALGLGATPAQAAAATQNSTNTSQECAFTEIFLKHFRVLDTAFVGGTPDGLFGWNDARAVAEGKKREASPLLRKGARLLTKGTKRTNRWFNTLDVSNPNHDGPADRLISRDDLRGYLDEYC